MSQQARPRKSKKQVRNLAPHPPHGDRTGGQNGAGTGHNRLQIPGDPATGQQATYPKAGKRGRGYYGQRRQRRRARDEQAARARAGPSQSASPPPLPPASRSPQ